MLQSYIISLIVMNRFKQPYVPTCPVPTSPYQYVNTVVIHGIFFSSQASRKISKFGYLFVAPETFDFSNPLDRSRVSEDLFLYGCLKHVKLSADSRA